MFKQPAMSDKLQFVAESLIQSFGSRRQTEVCQRVVDPRFQEGSQCLIGSAHYTQLVQQAVLRLVCARCAVREFGGFTWRPREAEDGRWRCLQLADAALLVGTGRQALMKGGSVPAVPTQDRYGRVPVPTLQGGVSCTPSPFLGLSALVPKAALPYASGARFHRVLAFACAESRS